MWVFFQGKSEWRWKSECIEQGLFCSTAWLVVFDVVFTPPLRPNHARLLQQNICFGKRCCGHNSPNGAHQGDYVAVKKRSCKLGLGLISPAIIICILSVSTYGRIYHRFYGIVPNICTSLPWNGLFKIRSQSKAIMGCSFFQNRTHFKVNVVVGVFLSKRDAIILRVWQQKKWWKWRRFMLDLFSSRLGCVVDKGDSSGMRA